MKPTATFYYHWGEESCIVSGTCRINKKNTSLRDEISTEIVVTNKKIILKNQQAVQIIYLSSVTSVELIESSDILIYYTGENNYQRIRIYNNAAWTDELFEGINDAVSKIK